MSKKRIFTAGIIGIIFLLGIFYKFFYNNEKVWVEKVKLQVWQGEIDVDKFKEYYSNEEIWKEKQQENKYRCTEFDFNDVTNHGDGFYVRYIICIDKSMRKNLKDIATNIVFPAELNNYCLDYELGNGNPFEYMGVRENGDVVLFVSFMGVSREKSIDEIAQMIEKVSVELQIQYVDGQIELKTIKVENLETEDMLYAKRDYLVEKEN